MDYHLSAVAEFFSGITLMPPTLGAYIALALGLLLLLCSAFVSGSEIAFFSLSPADMNELEERRTSADRRVLQLLQDSERLLATILCSNNFVNVAIIMLLTFFFNQTVDFGWNKVLEFLVKELHRTATIREERGGFSGRREQVLVSVLSRSEAKQLRVFLRDNDPDAFITIVSSSEIVGRGFRGV
jgi:uncharacterized membrane-anchored protein YitT (DUF2179 family)